MSDSNDRMISYCGLICTECPAFLATQENDAEKIAAVAKMWSKEYGIDVPPESVWCDGCTVEGRKCGHCHECDVRACAMEKGVENCGACGEFKTCATIAKFMEFATMVKPVLEEINRNFAG